jgi:site-specific recombinase XerD/predicted nucleic acid-binding Zn ribbon protein
MPTSKYIEDREYNIDYSNIDGKQEQILREWMHYLQAERAGEQRRYKLNRQFQKLFVRKANIDFDELSKEDIQHLKRIINTCDEWSATTKDDYRRLIRQFTKWYLNEYHVEELERVRDAVDTMKIGNQESDIDPRELLTKDDINQLREACENSRDRAFVHVLYDGGFRIGEMLNLDKQDVEVKPQSVDIRVSGKTGRRKVKLVRSRGDLLQWLRNHPMDEETSGLWVCLHPKYKGKQLEYPGATKLLKRCKENASLSKPCNPHHFRHSRATDLASNLTERSDQVQRYVNLCDEDLHNEILSHHGIEPEKEVKDTKGCPHCNSQIPQDDGFCNVCNQPISREEQESRENILNELLRISEKIQGDEALRTEFNEFIN